jgi:hypothetical protein
MMLIELTARITPVALTERRGATFAAPNKPAAAAASKKPAKARDRKAEFRYCNDAVEATNVCSKIGSMVRRQDQAYCFMNLAATDRGALCR